MKRFDLVVTDLDGTLWETPEHVPETTCAALADVLAGPVPLLVATGRRVASTRDPLDALGAAPPAVVLNGGLGLDLATAERFHVGGFPVDEAAAVHEVFASLDLVPCVYVDHDHPSVFVGSSPSTHVDHLRSFGADVAEADLATVVADHTVLAYGLLGLAEDVAVPLGEALSAVATPHVSPDRQYGGWTVTVAPATTSKWDAVLSFCERHGLDPTRVLALGDGPNDLELLEHAALAIAPRDAHPDALALADRVMPRAADGGWATVLDALG